MIEAITNPQNIVLTLATLAAFMSVVGVSMPFLQRDNFASRLEAVTKRREELSLNAKENLRPKKRIRRVQANRVNLMKAILDRLKIDNLLGSKKMRIRMSQAGWHGQGPIITYVFTRLALPLILPLVAALIVFGGKNVELDLWVKLGICWGAGIVGLYLPNILVHNVIQKRQQTLLLGFPDALDLLVICVEAGLSVEAAFNRISEELSSSFPNLAEEFGFTIAELSFLGDRYQALQNFADRTGLEATRSLTTTLIQAEKYGTPLGVSLRVLSQENRDARMLRAEQKAAKLPATLTIPMIIFFLPVVFLVVLGPAVIQVIEKF